jgi:hypothetical protein
MKQVEASRVKEVYLFRWVEVPTRPRRGIAMKNHGMIARAASVTALLASLSVAGGAQQPKPTVTASDPEVSVNIKNENNLRARKVDFTATPGSYVTIIRVNSEGTVEVLYPSTAVVDRAMIPSTKRVPVPKTPTSANLQSAGSIYAFVSTTPYVYSKVADKNGWNTLHLANYAAVTDVGIAESFGNEIAAPNSRVIMSKATTAPPMIVSHDHRPTVASLASFKNQRCPTTSFALEKGNGVSGCVLKSVLFPFGQGAPMQTQRATTPTSDPQQQQKANPSK